MIFSNDYIIYTFSYHPNHDHSYNIIKRWTTQESCTSVGAYLILCFVNIGKDVNLRGNFTAYGLEGSSSIGVEECA